MSVRRWWLGLCVGVCAPCALLAGPVLVGSGAFQPSDVLITFTGIGDQVPINTQYSAQGVTFNGALYGLTNPGDLAQFPSNGGGYIASNWRYWVPPYGQPFGAQFAAVATRVGFWYEANPADDLLVTTYRNNVAQGTVHYEVVSIAATFVGIQDLAGFDRIHITTHRADNGFMAIDDFRFDSQWVDAPIPEPSSLALLGLSGVALLRRRRRA